MQASGKVIMFKTSGSMQHAHSVFEEESAEIVDGAGKEYLIKKAIELLDEMEETWEMDHNAVDLRDSFHLLRYYLKRFKHT